MEHLPEVINNQEESRFEIHIGEHMAYQEYIQTKTEVIITHTEVPESLEGKGLGSLLAKNALTYTEENGLKIRPLCPFMAAYMRKHYDTYKHLLVPAFDL